jgi:lysine 2,3-aminomutase
VPIEYETISLADLAILHSIDPKPLLAVAERYPFRLSASYAKLIKYPGDPIWLQTVPSEKELDDQDDLLPDPLHEEQLSPVPGLIHRYPDRAVLLVSNSCATYCRFCMRKRKVGIGASCNNDTVDIDQAIDYLRSKKQIKDLLLSGGDPLTLKDETLQDILLKLRTIPHVDIIRIGTRIPVVQPSRITPALCKMLAAHHPLFINTHFNHPAELTTDAQKACAMLADSGIPLGNQTVLLKGVNDDHETLKNLFIGLLKLRVRPYYLHQMDLVQGTGHFRTNLGNGIKLAASLRGKISGMAIPHYVVDLPGGKGKVPLQPENAVKDGKNWKIRTSSGETIIYPDCF